MESPESPIPSASASVPIDPTPSPTPVLPTLPGWQVIDLAIEDGYAYSIAESDRGWVAVGTGPTGPGSPAIWFSADGASWTEVQDVPDQYGGLYDVIVGGPGFVAFGNNADIDFGAPFAWTSPDGQHWVASDLNGTGAYGLVRGATQFDDQLLAGGGLLGENGPDYGPPVMWRSMDGARWTQTVLDTNGVEGADALPPVEFAGKLVTLGSGYHPPVGRVWQSVDGVAWQLQPDDPVWVNASLSNVAVLGERLVVVGDVSQDAPYTGRPAIWTSVDAQTWTSQYLGPCCAAITWVMKYGEGGIALGNTVVYTSADGRTWDFAGTITNFHGRVVKLVNTRTYGPVAIGQVADSSVLLVPPSA